MNPASTALHGYFRHRDWTRAGRAQTWPKANCDQVNGHEAQFHHAECDSRLPYKPSNYLYFGGTCFGTSLTGSTAFIEEWDVPKPVPPNWNGAIPQQTAATFDF